MQFVRKNISKTQRNGRQISYVTNSTAASSDSVTFSGDFLPASYDEETNVYIVPNYVSFIEKASITDEEGNETEVIKNLLEITKDGIKVNGNIIATGDVTAYGTSGSSGENNTGSVVIYDGLDSESIEMALSANQGRVLYDYIGNTEEILDQIIGNGSIEGDSNNSENVDLSNYYTKAEIDAKIQDSGTTDLSNYYTKSEVNSLIDGVSAGQIDLTNYYTKSEIDTALTNYNTKSEIVNLLKTEQDRITSLEGYFTLANDTLTTSHNIVSTKEITSYSDARLKSNIKQLTNRGELNPVTYIKDGKESIGFIAQDVAELYPELVIQDGEYMALNYQQLTAVLAAQINELKKEIEELKKMV